MTSFRPLSVALLTLIVGLVLAAPSAAQIQTRVMGASNGTAGSLDVAAAPSLFAPSAGLTVEAWATYDGSSLGSLNRFPTIARAGLLPGWSWFLRVDAGTTRARILRFAVRTVSNGLVNLTHPFAEGEYRNWTHIAATYDGSRMAIIINGREVASGPGGGPIVDNSGAPGGTSIMAIGEGRRDPIFHNEVWNGSLARVRVWSVPLPDSVLRSFLFTRLGATPGLEGEWIMDGQGMDSSGLGRNGTIFGSLSWPMDMPPEAFLFQENSPAASLQVGDASGFAMGTPFLAASQALALTVPGSLQLDTTLANNPGNLVVSFGSLAVPGNAGGLGTPAGQVVNVDLFTAPPFFAFGGGLGNLFAAPIAGTTTLGVGSPAPLDAAAQMLILDPANADGFSLSAPAELEVR